MLVQYNRETYDVTIEIARINLKDTTKIVTESVYTLVNDNISKISIINDLNTCYPYLELEYNDISSLSVTNYPCDGYTLININISHNSEDKSFNIKHTFVVDDISIASNSLQQIYYKITGSSITSINLKSKIDYSTNKKILSATKICKDLLTIVGYPIEPVNEPDSTNKLQYITPVNYSVLDNLNYLLHYASNDATGIYYLIYNLIKQQGKVVSINQLFTNSNLTNLFNYNNFIIPSKSGINDQYTTIYDVKYNNFIKGSNTYDIAGKVTFNNFDYINRRWSQDVYNFNRINSSLPKLPNNYGYRSVYKNKPNIVGGNRFNTEQSNISFPELFKKLDKLYKYYSDIQFNCFGNISRDIGQVIQVNAYDKMVNSKYGGFYMIARIYHTFIKDNYTCNVTAMRTMEQKPEIINE